MFKFFAFLTSILVVACSEKQPISKNEKVRQDLIDFFSEKTNGHPYHYNPELEKKANKYAECDDSNDNDQNPCLEIADGVTVVSAVIFGNDGEDLQQVVKDAKTYWTTYPKNDQSLEKEKEKVSLTNSFGCGYKYRVDDYGDGSGSVLFACFFQNI